MSKLQKEEIKESLESSLSWLINPKLRDFYFWHFHPEIELVLIEAVEGNRHIANHKAVFRKSDLVLIGSNLPHLNFDFGIKTDDYFKTVLHIQADFLKDISSTKELAHILRLLEDAKFGLSFGQNTIEAIGGQFKKLHQRSNFEQFTGLLEIFHTLAHAEDKTIFKENQHIDMPSSKDHKRIEKIKTYVVENYQNKIELAAVANLTNLTPEAFCRYFKKNTKLSFVSYLNQFRINRAKAMINAEINISEVAMACGFENVSYFNKVFKTVTGKNPSEFKA